MDKTKALPIGTLLDGGKYPLRITTLLSADSQGFLYRARATVETDDADKVMETVVREHFMSYCSDRDRDGKTVVTPDEIRPTVEGCLNDFTMVSDLRRNVADGHPGIINVIDCFAQNNTYYYVVERLDGPTLEEYVEANGPLSLEETRRVMGPIFRAASHMHRLHAIHTDIHPRHIRFTSHGDVSKPVLFSLYSSIHFDDAGHRLCNVHNVNCRKGYAPPEQYVEIDHFLPQIDIYALGATMVYALTGKHLPDSRKLNDTLIREALPDGLPEVYASALAHALTPDIAERTLSITGFFDELKLTYGVEQRAPRPTRQKEARSNNEGSGRRMKVMAGVTAAAIIALIIAIIALF